MLTRGSAPPWDRAGFVAGFALLGTYLFFAICTAAVGDVRGRRLAIGVDLITDPTSREPATDLAAKTVYRIWELGGVVYYVGGNVLEVTPPLVLTDEEADRAVDLLVQGIRDAAAGKVSDEQVAPFAGW